MLYPVTPENRLWQICVDQNQDLGYNIRTDYARSCFPSSSSTLSFYLSDLSKIMQQQFDIQPAYGIVSCISQFQLCPSPPRASPWELAFFLLRMANACPWDRCNQPCNRFYSLHRRLLLFSAFYNQFSFSYICNRLLLTKDFTDK